MEIDDSTLSALAKAVQDLAPVPRQSTWSSLSLCVIDAVFSVGARYSSTERAVLNVASDCDVTVPIVGCDIEFHDDPLPVSRLLEHYPSGVQLAAAAKNRQRTSSRGGILKAEATLRYAAVLAGHGIETIHDARALLGDPATLEAVERELRTVPGEGKFGVRLGYLWMLVGADDMVKPDRMVLRWLRLHTTSNLSPDGVSYSPEQARVVLKAVSDHIRVDTHEAFSLWEIDHAIWQAARRRPRV